MLSNDAEHNLVPGVANTAGQNGSFYLVQVKPKFGEYLILGTFLGEIQLKS